MQRLEALTKLKRVLRTIEEGKVPYRVEEVTVYGSVVEGEKRVRDLDLYIQLDRESVPEEDLLQEVFGGHGRGAGTQLRMALKESNQERIEIQWEFEPWETRREKGVALVYITQRLTDLAAIRANTATIIFMRSQWQADVKRADIETGGMENYGKLLPTLKIGTGIVNYAEVGTFPVKFRPSLTHPFKLSDKEVRGLMEPHKAGREAAELLTPEEEPEPVIEEAAEKPWVVRVEPTLPDPELLYESVMAWLEERDECPRVADMKIELGWDPKRANNAINLLVD